jgi:hypothetical protein
VKELKGKGKLPKLITQQINQSTESASTSTPKLISNEPQSQKSLTPVAVEPKKRKQSEVTTETEGGVKTATPTGTVPTKAQQQPQHRKKAKLQ